MPNSAGMEQLEDRGQSVDCGFGNADCGFFKKQRSEIRDQRSVGRGQEAVSGRQLANSSIREFVDSSNR